MIDHTHSRQFPNTRWTIVALSAVADDATRKKALNDLCSLYWPPVYAFVRSKGNSPHDAEDLTQGFFEQLLTRDDFARTDASKGKLRTFLLAAVKNFMASEWKKANRQKRGGGRSLISIDMDAAEPCFRANELVDGASPDKLYERQWVLTLLGHVLTELGQRYDDDGKGSLFEMLRPALTPGAEMPSYAEIAGALQMTEAAIKVAVHRLRQRYGMLLKESIADTLGPNEDPDAELSYLMTVFA